ncbi:Arylsulfotransferase-domain-containing protein [Nemania sp. FL0916]|nr:Arylsulfotransferase-domain-containing protein [Nemania sp. FL0916]
MIRILSWLLFAIVASDARAGAYQVLSSAYLYKLGFYGCDATNESVYPTTSYKSSALTPPRLNFPARDSQNCSEGGYYLIAQKGKLVSTPGPTIFDSRGELVWASQSFGVVFNLQVQTYAGEQYLTFWASPEGSIHGYGRGTYYMLDASYEIFRTLEPAGNSGLKGDLHEFHITPRGSALITIYNSVPADLSAIGGPEKGWALDCIFQEIDIETGALVFEWSAFEHVAINATVRTFAGEDDGTTPESAFDFFHINSVDVDGEGNYIISARHTSTILCISPHGGKILWTLGGKASDFFDASGGAASDFMYQHDVRPQGEDQRESRTLTLSIFDNAAAERAGELSPYSQSRGLLVRLDTTNMTVSLLRSYTDPVHTQRAASSQGSMQVLPDRVVLGYGWLPYITEFARDTGDVLCAVELAPAVTARWGLINTYRAFKVSDWVGRPAAPPDVYFDRSASEEMLFVSWNGATEVERWVLQGMGAGEEGGVEDGVVEKGEEEGFEDVDIIDKESFETAFTITGDMPRYLRIAAVDSAGTVLAHSRVVDRETENVGADWFLRNVLVSGVIFIVVVIAIRRLGWRALREHLTPRRNRLVRAVAASGASWGRRSDLYAAITWWRDTGGAKTHELRSLYHD